MFSFSDQFLSANKRKRDFLKTEIRYIEHDKQLRLSLQINNPDLDLAFKTLEHMETFKLHSLMFLKNPSLLDTIQKVTKYVGEISKPNGNAGRRAHLQYKIKEKQTENIRKIAEKVLCKIKLLFIVSDGQIFQEVFNNATYRFMNKVRFMNTFEIYGLCPDTYIDDDE